jgi:hypothetical protein
MAQLGREVGSSKQERVRQLFGRSRGADDNAKADTDANTKRKVEQEQQRKRQHVNTSTHQLVNTSTRQRVNTATRQHGECSAGGGEAQKLSWEVWALRGVVSDTEVVKDNAGDV